MVFVLLMILWMGGIFAFSSRSGSESADDSYFVGTMVGELFVPGFDDWSVQEQQEFAQKIDYPVRKTAHATEYAILGILAAGVCIPTSVRKSGGRAAPGKNRNSRSVKIGRELLLPWGIAAVYAATDEFHQLFVPGRSGQLSDVILDSTGALAGLLILTSVRKIRNRYQVNTEK